MRLHQGGISHTAWVIEDDLRAWETALRKQHREGLAAQCADVPIRPNTPANAVCSCPICAIVNEDRVP